MKYTEHHLYPRNWVDGRWLDTEINKKMLPIITHINHHRIFGNMEFHYQILQILALNAQIVQKSVLKEVSAIMWDDLSYIYKNWVFIPRTF